MNSRGGEADIADVCALELELLDPATRGDADHVARLVHPDFVEIGASGAVWDRDGVIAALAADPERPVEVTDLSGSVLADGVVLVTYVARERGPDGTASRRSSVWMRVAGRWQVRFHHGTPLGS